MFKYEVEMQVQEVQEHNMRRAEEQVGDACFFRVTDKCSTNAFYKLRHRRLIDMISL